MAWWDYVHWIWIVVQHYNILLKIHIIFYTFIWIFKYINYSLILEIWGKEDGVHGFIDTKGIHLW